MAFILFIIITLALLLKAGSDKAAVADFRRWSDNKIAEESERFNNFCKRHEDQYLERQIRNRVSWGEEESSNMRQSVRDSVGIEPTDEMVVMSLMALKCKIPYDFIYYGISAPCRNPSMLTPEDYQKRTKDQLKFLKWYDKLLKDSGMRGDELIGLERGEFTTKDGSKNKTLWSGYRKEYIVSDMCALQGEIFCWHGNADRVRVGYSSTIYK